MNNTEIKYSKYGIANRFDDGIYLNEGLKAEQYQLLHDWLVAHELSHSEGSTTKKDFMVDFQDTFFKPKQVSKQYFKFYFTHLWAWLQSSPVWIHNGKILLDLPKLFNIVITSFITGAIIIWWVYAT